MMYGAQSVNTKSNNPKNHDVGLRDRKGESF